MPVTVAASERAAASALKKFGQRLGDLIMWLSRKKCANSRSPSMENLRIIICLLLRGRQNYKESEIMSKRFQKAE